MDRAPQVTYPPSRDPMQDVVVEGEATTAEDVAAEGMAAATEGPPLPAHRRGQHTEVIRTLVSMCLTSQAQPRQLQPTP